MKRAASRPSSRSASAWAWRVVPGRSDTSPKSTWRVSVRSGEVCPRWCGRPRQRSAAQASPASRFAIQSRASGADCTRATASKPSDFNQSRQRAPKSAPSPAATAPCAAPARRPHARSAPCRGPGLAGACTSSSSDCGRVAASCCRAPWRSARLPLTRGRCGGIDGQRPEQLGRQLEADRATSPARRGAAAGQAGVAAAAPGARGQSPRAAAPAHPAGARCAHLGVGHVHARQPRHAGAPAPAAEQCQQRARQQAVDRHLGHPCRPIRWPTAWGTKPAPPAPPAPRPARRARESPARQAARR